MPPSTICTTTLEQHPRVKQATNWRQSTPTAEAPEATDTSHQLGGSSWGIWATRRTRGGGSSCAVRAEGPGETLQQQQQQQRVSAHRKPPPHATQEHSTKSLLQMTFTETPRTGRGWGSQWARHVFLTEIHKLPVCPMRCGTTRGEARAKAKRDGAEVRQPSPATRDSWKGAQIQVPKRLVFENTGSVSKCASPLPL